MEFGLLKTFSISVFGFCLLLLFIGITATLNIDKNSLSINAQQNTTNNPCPQTMTMVGATYVDKQGCIQPCPTSDTQGQIPEGCPQQPLQSSNQEQQPALAPQQEQSQQQQLPEQQSGEQLQPQEQQSQQQPALAPQQEQAQQLQNGSLANKNTLINPNDIKLKNKIIIFGGLSCPGDLSGTWQGNDGGTYYIKQDGNKIVWWGSNIFNGGIGANPMLDRFGNIINAFNNIAEGTLSADGNTITANYDDTILISYFHNEGQITLSVDPSGTKLVKVSSTGGFGGSEWTRECNNQ